MTIRRIAAAGVLLSLGLVLQGCLAATAAGTAVGVTGAVVGTTVRGAGAVGRAVIPGDSRDD